MKYKTTCYNSNHAVITWMKVDECQPDLIMVTLRELINGTNVYVVSISTSLKQNYTTNYWFNTENTLTQNWRFWGVTEINMTYQLRRHGLSLLTDWINAQLLLLKFAWKYIIQETIAQN